MVVKEYMQGNTKIIIEDYYFEDITEQDIEDILEKVVHMGWKIFKAKNNVDLEDKT